MEKINKINVEKLLEELKILQEEYENFRQKKKKKFNGKTERKIPASGNYTYQKTVYVSWEDRALIREQLLAEGYEEKSNSFEVELKIRTRKKAAKMRAKTQIEMPQKNDCFKAVKSGFKIVDLKRNISSLEEIEERLFCASNRHKRSANADLWNEKFLSAWGEKFSSQASRLEQEDEKNES